jgi:leucyl-tRNA synthetase
LPVELPEMSDFTPSADGSPPLARATEWVNTTDPATDRPARRDTDTMPGWAGSCWYWLRFMDPHNDAAPFSEEAQRYWGPVDLYVGGASHAVLHLLYALFWHKVFYDIGLVDDPEPFRKLFNQGMLTAPAYQDKTGRRIPADEIVERNGQWIHEPSGDEVRQFVASMSKSLRNVINPDDVIEEHGADAFRLYEMFMAPLADGRTWDPRGISGCRRFLERAWRLYVDPDGDHPIRPQLLEERPEGPRSGANEELERALNGMLKRVDDSFEQFNFNTAIAGMMTFVNEALKRPDELDRGQATRFVLALAPFAPHIAEELWQRLGNYDSVASAPWPEVDPHHLTEDSFELVVQVMGRVRGRTQAPRSADKDELTALARETVARHLADKRIVNTIVVPGRLVNFVVK